MIPSEILVTKLSAHQFNRFINSKNISRRFDQRKENNKRQTMRNKKESTDIFLAEEKKCCQIVFEKRKTSSKKIETQLTFSVTLAIKLIFFL